MNINKTKLFRERLQKQKLFFKQKWKKSKYFKYVFPFLIILSCGFMFCTIFGFTDNGIEEHNQYDWVIGYEDNYNKYRVGNDVVGQVGEDVAGGLNKIFLSDMSVDTFNKGIDIYQSLSMKEKNDLDILIKKSIIDNQEKNPYTSIILKNLNFNYYANNTKFSLAIFSIFPVLVIWYMSWYYIANASPTNEWDIINMTETIFPILGIMG